ncbi:OLC1v1034827C1 [Oldenlandia corymbosa var. corymbosa]|uniref:OLC1v1034827C1 n=1 Tax=Oldenlandia corymbosa var. corymbosa TaxID=529605 RepID=A0AAV1CUM2_OLDCO|nr:OLC1v1034827C1 [Oldenlandia corymbosa var. corymbosa]
MDSNNFWTAPGPALSTISGGGAIPAVTHIGYPAAMDWRTHLQADFRQRVLNKIFDSLIRHLPFQGQEGMEELKEIAIRFEEKIYSTATSQSDYMREISLKMLSMEKENMTSKFPMVNTMQSTAQGQMPPGPSEDQVINGGAMVTNIAPQAVLDAQDWKTQLQADSRERIRNKILCTLMRDLSLSGQGVEEVDKIVMEFQEKMYSVATSQSDYLRKISLKLLSVTKSQIPGNYGKTCADEVAEIEQ